MTHGVFHYDWLLNKAVTIRQLWKISPLKPETPVRAPLRTEPKPGRDWPEPWVSPCTSSTARVRLPFASSV